MPRHLLCLLIGVSLVFAAGCGAEPPVAAKSTEPSESAVAKSSNFDSASCGSITGLVTWVGPIPEVAPVTHVTPRADGTGTEARLVPLANAPKVDRFTRGVEGVVVFIREIDPTRAKPWDLPPAVVEFRDSQIAVRQGERVSRAGFVRKGGSVEMRSAEANFNILRGRGAAFFSLAFPDPDRPATRTFDTCGRVELTNPAGGYWQAADLFVCDHPYYAVTDAEGRYTFENVPAGLYDLVAWHPNWNVVGKERNPESGVPSVLKFAAPLETSRPVTVLLGQPRLANLTIPE